MLLLLSKENFPNYSYNFSSNFNIISPTALVLFVIIPFTKKKTIFSRPF